MQNIWKYLKKIPGDAEEFGAKMLDPVPSKKDDSPITKTVLMVDNDGFLSMV